MIKVGIVGATGLVGQTIVKVLKEENLLSVIDLTFFASDKNYGKIISYYGKEFRLINLSEKIKQQKFDVVFFSAGDEISRQWVHVFEENGAYVIDNTNAFRKEELVPLIVPEINAEKITKNSKIIANPNCSTIQLAVVLDRLLKVSAISNIVVSTYQSVSGAGSKAVSDLKNKTNKVISAGIYDNVIAQIGSFDKCGFSTEENKIMFETNKILDADISVVATAVRVPVSFCHTESVYVKFKNKIEMSKIQMCFNIEMSHFSLFFLIEMSEILC